MHDGSKRLAAYIGQIQAGIDSVIYKADYCNVVATDNVQPENNLLDARRCGEDALMALVDDDVNGLVESFQRPYKVASICSNYGYCVVDVGLQAGHGASSQTIFGLLSYNHKQKQAQIFVAVKNVWKVRMTGELSKYRYLQYNSCAVVQ